MKVTIEIMLTNHAGTQEEAAAFDKVAIAKARQFMATLLDSDTAKVMVDMASIVTSSQGAVDLQ